MTVFFYLDQNYKTCRILTSLSFSKNFQAFVQQNRNVKLKKKQTDFNMNKRLFFPRRILKTTSW